jgi:histidine ammonia-lyase
MRDAQFISHVCLDEADLSMAQFVAVARHGARISFAPGYCDRVNHSRKLIEIALQENRRIYGVTTGFGDNARTIISPEDSEILQRNIVLSHACSVGDPLPEEQIRAIALMWLLSLGKGYSGVRLKVLALVAELLNAGVTPVAPGDGSVGYLSVEAHMALVLIGEGKACYRGQVLPGREALTKTGLSPVTLQCKEGLALTNGTNSVTGLAILSAWDAIKAARCADIISAMSFDALKGTIRSCDPRLHSVKRHREQAATARNLVRILEGSSISSAFLDVKVQDASSLRCIPPIHGAAKNALKHAANIIADEMNSCSDNPILFPQGDDGDALMGANFDGTFVGIQADTMCIAMANLAKLSERRLDRMVNWNFSDLASFLAKKPGLNSGMMIPQYTAAGLLGEIKILSHPSTIDSTPTCANQEDPVSLAYFAAKKSISVGSKLEHILAIELMAAAQALEFLAPLASSLPIRELHRLVRSVVPKLEEDRYLYDDIMALLAMVHSGDLVRTVEAITGPLEL